MPVTTNEYKQTIGIALMAKDVVIDPASDNNLAAFQTLVTDSKFIPLPGLTEVVAEDEEPTTTTAPTGRQFAGKTGVRSATYKFNGDFAYMKTLEALNGTEDWLLVKFDENGMLGTITETTKIKGFTTSLVQVKPYAFSASEDGYSEKGIKITENDYKEVDNSAIYMKTVAYSTREILALV